MRNEITATYIHPQTIARKLKVPSLISPAYEIHKDGSATFGTAIKKARTSKEGQDLCDLRAFAAEYRIGDDRPTAHPLSKLDPRTAELCCQVFQPSATEPKLFLPVLYEDPHGKSAWRCGSAYRQLAYSILASIVSWSRGEVCEYYKKGEAIRPNAVCTLGKMEQAQTVDAVLQLAESASVIPVSSIGWYMTALHVVVQERAGKGWLVDLNRFRALMGCSNGSREAERGLIHLEAQVQAVLYSLRILKQIVDFVLALDDTKLPDQQPLQSLAYCLSTMPSISELFTNPSQRQNLVETSYLDVDTLLAPIMSLLPTIRGKATKKTAPLRREDCSTLQGQMGATQSKSRAGGHGYAAASHNVFDALYNIG
jgi:hypothetical protein